MNKNKRNGFSLVEMVITMLVFSILTFVAVPVYNHMMDKSKIVETITTAHLVKTWAERFQQDHKTYDGYCESNQLRELLKNQVTLSSCDDGDEDNNNNLVFTISNTFRNKNGTPYISYQYSNGDRATISVPDGYKLEKKDVCWIYSTEGWCSDV